MKHFILICTILTYCSCDVTRYYAQRAMLVQTESSLAIGGNTTLDPKETMVNNCLMQHKLNELDDAFNRDVFMFSKHYFSYKKTMRQSKVYKIIKHMPKGAALHVHDLALLGPDHIMNITYMDNLYVRFQPLDFRFANHPPSSDWLLMEHLRRDTKNLTKFDADLRKHFTIVTDEPSTGYPGPTDSWARLDEYFRIMKQLLTYFPIWEQHIYNALKTFREDQVIYMEIRSSLPWLYDLNGTILDLKQAAQSYQKIVNKFKKDFPDFIGVKLIYAQSKSKSLNGSLDAYIERARRTKDQVPDLFAGFDLVGREETSWPLIDLVPKLSQVNDMTFFFHAGETDWSGTVTDGNLYDAILLGSRRIGHAYALIKHPQLMKEVINRDIALEVNLISNSILSYLRDIRNHPLNTYIANGMPVVLSSDDPGAWEAEPLSDDFYVAFVGASSRLSDLRLLKALGENSLKYSALELAAKSDALKKFHVQWKKFINDFDCSIY